jgi:hypothetical protein
MSGDSTGTEPVHPGPPPGLLRLVKVLGVVMVLLFLALIAGIIWKATRKPPPPVAQDVVVDLGIDPAAIRHMEMEGGNLAVSTDKELLVIDLKTRKITLRAFKPQN